MVSMLYQSGGETMGIAKTEAAKEKTLACGTEVHRLGDVALVSKTHKFSLDLLP